MRYLFVVIVLYFMCSMFKKNGAHKAGMILVTYMLFSAVLVPGVPIGWATQLVPLFLILSEVSDLKNNISYTKKSILSIFFGVVVLSTIILVITSPHLHDLPSLRSFLQTKIFFRYFICIYIFWVIRSEEDVKVILKYSKSGIIFLTLFGILNYITKSAEFVISLAGSDFQSGTTASSAELATYFIDRDRMRIQSLFMFPHDYGYICVITILFHIYAFIKKYEDNRTFILISICCAFGIIFCGCRTDFICAIFGILVILLISLPFTTYIRNGIVALWAILVLYITVPFVQTQIDTALSVFDPDYNESGSSSLIVRAMQFEATMKYVVGHELFGNGYDYFGIDLGWKSKDIVDRDLIGLESVIFNYLLERGFVGLFLYLTTIYVLFISIFKKRFYDKALAGFGVSVLCVYIIFAIMTGELNSLYPTMFFVGYVIKIQQLKMNNIRIES